MTSFTLPPTPIVQPASRPQRFAWARDWLAWVLFVGVPLWAVLGGLNLALDVGRPFGGYLVSRASSGIERWTIDLNTPSWGTGMVSSGLKPGQILLTLNGQAYNREHSRIFDTLTNGEVAIVEVLAEGQRETAFIRIQTFTWFHLLDLRWPDGLALLSFWLLSLIIYRAGPQTDLNRLIALLMVVIGLLRWLHQGVVFPVDEALDILLDVFVNGVLLNFVGVLALHLMLMFPISQPPFPFWPLRPVYGLACVLMGTRVLERVLVINHWATAEFSQTLTDGSVWIACGLVVAALGLAIVRWGAVVNRNWSRPYVRFPAVLFFVGLCVGNIPLGMATLTAFAFIPPERLSYFIHHFDIRYLLLALPLSIAFVSLRYQLFHVASPAVKYVLALAASGLLGSLGAWLIFTLDAHLTRPPVEVLTGLALISMVLAPDQLLLTLVAWSSSPADSALEIARFGQRLSPFIGQSDLMMTLAQAIQEETHTTQVALWLRDPQQPAGLAFQLRGMAGEWALRPPPITLAAMSEVEVVRRKSLWYLNVDVVPIELESLRTHPLLMMAVPLTLTSEVVGWVAFGQYQQAATPTPLTPPVFSPFDHTLWPLLIQQITLLVIAQRYVAELNDLPSRLAAVQERERLKLAQELHDTVQQFLGRLPFYLEVSRSLTLTTPQEAEALLVRCISDVEEAARIVRQIRQELSPLGLERSLATPLRELVNRFQAHYPKLEVQLSLDSQVDYALALSPEKRKALYRVTQQALENIATHAQASSVRVSVTQQDGQVKFSIQDNGRGFSEVERQQANLRERFGLRVMESRILTFGGQLAITSQPGEGTQVSGWLPVDGMPVG